VNERSVGVRSRRFLWIVAALIGSALAFSPVISSPLLAQEKGSTGATGTTGEKGATGATGAKGDEKKM